MKSGLEGACSWGRGYVLHESQIFDMLEARHPADMVVGEAKLLYTCRTVLYPADD